MASQSFRLVSAKVVALFYGVLVNSVALAQSAAVDPEIAALKRQLLLMQQKQHRRPKRPLPLRRLKQHLKQKSRRKPRWMHRMMLQPK